MNSTWGLSKRKPVYIPFPAGDAADGRDRSRNLHPVQVGQVQEDLRGSCGERKAIDFTQTEEPTKSTSAPSFLRPVSRLSMPRNAYYGYGRYPNVYTSLEVERLVNASGPTGGEVILRDGTKPKAVGIIHCVGSRDHNTNRWCSRVCCMYSLKLAHLIKEHTGAEVYNFYIDMRTPGKGYEEFYDRLLDEGVHFIRGRVAEVSDWAVHPSEEGEAGDPRRGHAGRIRSPDSGRHGRALGRSWNLTQDADDVRRMFNISCCIRWLVPGAASQVGAGQYVHGRYFHRRRLPGAQGHSRYGGPGWRGRGGGAGPDRRRLRRAGTKHRLHG